MQNLKFVIISFIYNFKDFLKFDLNFWIVLIISTIKQLLFIFAWMFFFNEYKLVKGWGFNEMLLMYGIVSFGIGVVEILFFGLRNLANLVNNNQLDIYLLQPKNIVLNIAVSKSDISAFGDFTIGIILVSWSGYLFKSFFLVLCAFTVSSIFMFALYLFLGSWSLYLKDSSSFIKDMYQNSILLATQPNSAYKGLIKLLTLTFIPVGFMSFYPIEYIVTKDIKFLIYSVIGTLAFLLISLLTFYHGLTKYNSGYLFSNRK
jgi:ABC-2 type transport system permease protein